MPKAGESNWVNLCPPPHLRMTERDGLPSRPLVSVRSDSIYHRTKSKLIDCIAGLLL